MAFLFLLILYPTAIMKKKLLVISIILFFSFQKGFAQFTQYCGTSRYDTEVFAADTVLSTVTFGSSVDVNGNTVTLTMDIYQPAGDVVTIRPLIIWAHGGSFINGTKNDGDVTSLCHHFAKRGYVCASINYRLGIPLPPTQTGATRAVYRAVQDMKAAVRFFRKDAATSNVYKIDPAVIFAGGSSAGAFIALHLAYLDQPTELPSQIDTNLLGGMEGISGNPGYPSTVNAIVNLCGALGDTAWMVPGDIPVCSMHGTVDNVVPYATSILYLFTAFPIMVVNGSHSVNEHADAIGIPNAMYTFYGQSHVPYATSLAYMDTTVRFVSNFLYDYLGCTPSDLSPLPNTFINVSVPELNSSQNINVYPAPASDHINIDLKNSSVEKIELVDVTGRTLRKMENISSTHVQLERGNLFAGIYFLRIIANGKTISRKICFE